ncbi:hypothetical protein BMH32_12310 [Leucobacter sp. OLJS4]|uniref:HdeD family acid-resistance protein n=1 Tax=unclassified Leucobacter TaxID=2621730 RepID=UPI000C1A1F86|nr:MULTISPECIES: DUF308 domain-containing protein [unclassified Leucobacter]PII86644.1 hypothetical protein BMH25_01000 [Leucobacter sp. OLCALW19]PII88990.1 hypothetical protein BMH27_15260 [Leucobacter sp. OLAS13]PII96079.1 hypothetical protein BMH26_01030 [Leucobacter sp. OLTLW20]PII99353.1 hypothetical protein BMH29_05475 [Leucobacter sp. OLDS2]PIJ01685.1 hypothetical protein BMH28_05995 [Leucobacter sp. OLCS4]
MTWEVVPESTGPRAETRRFPWWILLVVGILVTAAGVGLLFWPFIAASWFLVVVLGSALIANGLAILVRRPSGAAVAAGIVLIAGGVLAMVFSDFTVTALVTFVGVSVLFVGAFWLVLAIRAGGRSGLVLMPAILAILAGVVTLVWPDFALKFVAVIAGIFTLFIGISLILSATALRRLLASGTRAP